MPNQSEVDYYKQEGFLTNEDYQDAVRLGVPHSNIQNMTISGFTTKDDLQKNIKYLNSGIFLNAYKEQDGITLLENRDISVLIDKANKAGKYNKPITKLSNFDYYYIKGTSKNSVSF